MSHQGNVVSRMLGMDLFLTSGRWGGACTPEDARRALKEALDERDGIYRRENDFMSAMMFLESQYSPIRYIGNSDVPLVIVDWDRETVTWQNEHDRRVLGSWTIAEYVALDLEKVEGYEEAFL